MHFQVDGNMAPYDKERLQFNKQEITRERDIYKRKPSASTKKELKYFYYILVTAISTGIM